jgi:hypothetical protein
MTLGTRIHRSRYHWTVDPQRPQRAVTQDGLATIRHHLIGPEQ